MTTSLQQTLEGCWSFRVRSVNPHAARTHHAQAPRSWQACSQNPHSEKRLQTLFNSYAVRLVIGSTAQRYDVAAKGCEGFETWSVEKDSSAPSSRQPDLWEFCFMASNGQTLGTAPIWRRRGPAGGWEGTGDPSYLVSGSSETVDILWNVPAAREKYPQLSDWTITKNRQRGPVNIIISNKIRNFSSPGSTGSLSVSGKGWPAVDQY